MSRNLKRAALAVTSALALGATAACGGGAAGESDTLTVTMWGGSSQTTQVDSYFKPWAEAQEVKLLQDQPTDYAKLKAQVDSGKVSWGVVQVEPHFARTACEDGMLEKLDTTTVDTSALDQQKVTDCAVPIEGYAFTIGYNTDEFDKEHPTTWAEFFDTEKFPGKRGFWKYVTGGIFEAALLADGVPADELYPLDLDRAFAKLDTVKDDLVFYETGDQQIQLLSSGEAPLVQAWNGRVVLAAKDGQPVANEWNQNLQSYEQVVIPKGYPNTDTAMEWMSHFVNDVEGQSNAANINAYAPANDAALEKVDPEIAGEMSTNPENLEKSAITVDYDYWAENYDAVSERFNEWLAS